MADKPHNLEGLLDELAETAARAGKKVSVEEVYREIGARSFGPLLLTVGLLGMTPVSAVPTAPSILAVIVILIAGQLLIGRKTLWLPRKILKLSVDTGRLTKALEVTRKPARFADRLVRPRLAVLTGGLADRIVALACVVVAATIPPLELVPLMAFVPALAIFAFGLGLVARDGLLILIAFAAAGGALSVIAWRLLG